MAVFDQELETIRLAVGVIQREAVRAAQKWAKTVPAEIKALFDAERYADQGGTLRRLGSIQPRWKARKIALGLDPRRGHASLGISRSLGRTNLVQNTDNGFDISALRAARGVTTKYPRGVRTPGFRRVNVSDYIVHYAAQKAIGFLSLSADQRFDLEQVVLKAIEPMVANLRKSAARSGQRSLALDVEVNLGRVGVSVATRAIA